MLEPIAEFLRAGAALADNDAVPWKTLVVYLLWAVYLFETYVALRQYRQYSLPTPPKALVPYVSLDTFAKSQRYGRDKARTALMAEAIDLDVSAPVITLSLLERLRSREKNSFSDRMLSALRNQFGGHAMMKE